MFSTRWTVYEELNFDEWLEEGTKEELLKELKERWEAETQSVCIFMSATERSNVDGLREALLQQVKELYKDRVIPTEQNIFFSQDAVFHSVKTANI